MKINSIDIELARSVFEYAPDLGGSCLKWKQDRVSGKNKVQCRAGSMAGSKDAKGYWRVWLNGVMYKAHRIIWSIVKGEDPQCQIDHINGHLYGNSIDNLRLANRNHSDNRQNTAKQKNNTTGFVGVSQHKRSGKYRATISVNGIYKSLGLFVKPEEANKVYLKAKKELHLFQPTTRE